MRRVLITIPLSAIVLVVQAVFVPGFAIAEQHSASASQEFALGRQSYDRQDYPSAVKHFYAARKNLDSDATLHYYLANALSLTGHDEESRKEYLRCIEVEPGSHTASLARDALFGRGQNVFAFSQSSPWQRNVNYSPQRSANYIAPSYVSSSAAYRPLFSFVHQPPGGFSNPVISSYQPNLPSQTVSRTPDGQSVRQFIQDLNGQLSDRKRLAMSEAFYNPYRAMDIGTFTPMYTPRHRYHRGWENPSYPFPRPSYSPRYFGSTSQFVTQQRSLAYEQTAAGLESQLLNNNGAVKFNPKGSNLYIRYYGSGVVPIWQPEPVVELLAKQEKLVIDEPAPQPKRTSKAPGAKNGAQKTP